MAAIQNDRDLLLQAASPRVVPIPIPIDRIDGLPEALKSLRIKTSATTFIGSSGATNPATITLTAEKLGGLVGAVTWSVITGTGTLAPSGDSCAVTGSTVTGTSITIRARVTVGGINYDAQISLSKLGSLSAQEQINLTNQVVGQLAMGNVTGYGALALLNQVNLNTQTIGALNGQTQVTNLGALAFVNALAANQIGAGTLAAGVIYAGTVNVENLVGNTISGKSISGADIIYIGGVNASSPIALTRISGDEGRATVRGFLSVSRTDDQSSFEISRIGNLKHGNISLGVTAEFLGSSFTVRNESVGYANFQTSAAGGIILRHNNITMQNAAGAALMSAITARVSFNTSYVNLRNSGGFSGGINGDLVFSGSDLGININGTWWKFTKTLA